MCEIDMVETGGGNKVSVSKVEKNNIVIPFGCHQGETGEMTHDTTL